MTQSEMGPFDEYLDLYDCTSLTFLRVKTQHRVGWYVGYTGLGENGGGIRSSGRSYDSGPY